jgi:hypothetical protein
MTRRRRLAGALGVVVPVDAEQVERVRIVGLDTGQRGADSCGDPVRMSELLEGRQQYPGVTEPLDGPVIDALVNDMVL